MPSTNMKSLECPAVSTLLGQRLRFDGTGEMSWETWQCQIVDLLRSDALQALQVTSLDDVDWLAWQPYFSQGKSPRQAVEHALERAL